MKRSIFLILLCWPVVGIAACWYAVTVQGIAFADVVWKACLTHFVLAAGFAALGLLHKDPERGIPRLPWAFAIACLVVAMWLTPEAGLALLPLALWVPVASIAIVALLSNQTVRGGVRDISAVSLLLLIQPIGIMGCTDYATDGLYAVLLFGGLAFMLAAACVLHYGGARNSKPRQVRDMGQLQYQ